MGHPAPELIYLRIVVSSGFSSVSDNNLPVRIHVTNCGGSLRLRHGERFYSAGHARARGVAPTVSRRSSRVSQRSSRGASQARGPRLRGRRSPRSCIRGARNARRERRKQPAASLGMTRIGRRAVRDGARRGPTAHHPQGARFIPSIKQGCRSSHGPSAACVPRCGTHSGRDDTKRKARSG